jgi:diguanylate cyclase (GGDEF)-like protein
MAKKKETRVGEELERLKRENKALRTRLRAMEYDRLTSIYTRQAGEERLYAELDRFSREREKPISAAFIDGDRIKEINDTRGHKEGDRAIKAIARVIKATKRAYDIAFRYGGDEFVVVMPDTGSKGAQMFSKRFRDQISDIASIPSKSSSTVAASIGISTILPNDEGKIKELAKKLLGEADKNMYRQKSRRHKIGA